MADLYDLRNEGDRRFDIQIRTLREDTPELASGVVDRLRRYRHTLPDGSWILLADATATWTRAVTSIIDAHSGPPEAD